MIASGTGRARGSKAGGLQTLNTWRTVALATPAACCSLIMVSAIFMARSHASGAILSGSFAPGASMASGSGLNIQLSTTQTGVSTRVLEIYGGPFDDEKSASLMHQQAPQHCGWAGPEFIRRILQTDEQSVRDEYAKMTEEVYKLARSSMPIGKSL